MPVEADMQSRSSLVKLQIVQAGAGTGKTEGLALQILSAAKSLHQELGRVPRIIASTFTEKATAELRERVIQKTAATDPDWLHQFVRSSDDLFVSTLHGVFALLLHRFGSRLGLDPEFTIATPEDIKALFKQVLREEIQNNAEKWEPLFEHYTSLQMVDLFSFLIRQRQHFPQAFQQDFDWKGVCSQKLESLKADLRSFCKNFESYLCESDIKTLADDFSWETNAAWINDGLKPDTRKNKSLEFRAAWKTIQEKLEEFSEKTWWPTFNEAYDQMVSNLRELTMALEAKLESAKAFRGWLTFDDLEVKILSLLKDFPDVRETIQESCDFWFIDEFQDTSPIQKEILTLLFRQTWNAYFVGDPHQSIYRFRGADPYVFSNTLDEVKKANGIVSYLEVNYRSQPDLISFFNKAFSKFKAPPMALKPKGPPQGHALAHIHITPEADPLDVMVSEILRLQSDGFKLENIAVLVRKNDQARRVGQKLKDYGLAFSNFGNGGFYSKREILDFYLVLKFLIDPFDNEAFVGLARSPWVGIDDQTLFDWSCGDKKIPFWEHALISLPENPAILHLKKALADSEILPIDLVVTNLVEALGFLEFSRIDDPTGLVEANISKFLLTLKKASVRKDFSLSQFARDMQMELSRSEEEEAEPFCQPDKINVLTVHKSKGLKFDAVIIPFASEPSRFLHRSFESNRKGQWAIRMFHDSDEKMTAPCVFRSLSDERKAEEDAEAERLLYVALTRAAQQPILIGDDREKGWLASLDFEKEDGSYPEGYSVKNWEGPTALTAAKPNLKKAPAPMELKLTELKSSSKASFSVTELVTRIVGKAKEKNYTFRRLDLKKSLDVLRYGQAVHFAFEQMQYQKGKAWDDVVSIAMQRFDDVDWAQFQLKDLDFEGVKLEQIIADGFAEWPFTLKLNDAKLFGQVDLWGIMGDECWVIDYKSGQKPSREAREKAHVQLELYCLALDRHLKNPNLKFKCAVIYPSQKKQDVFVPRPINDILLSAVAATTAPEAEG